MFVIIDNLITSAFMFHAQNITEVVIILTQNIIVNGKKSLLTFQSIIVDKENLNFHLCVTTAAIITKPVIVAVQITVLGMKGFDEKIHITVTGGRAS